MWEKLSVCRTPIDCPRIVTVKKVVQESPDTRTFVFEDELSSKAEPGRFIMIWVPGVDENPMSLSNAHGEMASVTVRGWSRSSLALYKSKVGDRLGIRGPYGKSFTRMQGKCLLVGGGTGLAPLVPLAVQLAKSRSKVTLVIAGKSEGQLLLRKNALARLSGKKHRVLFTTEDGSYGMTGLASDMVEKLLQEEKFSMVYTCGPEKMMKKILDLAEAANVPGEASLERIMKCGIGLCGSCTIGRYLLCRDGPVLSFEHLRKVPAEFGVFWRRDSGTPVYL